MATGTATLTATATSAVTLSNPVSLDELQQLGAPTVNIDSSVDVEGLMGLEEGQYVIVEPTTTASTNGERLAAAYTDASALSGLSSTSRATVLVPPGHYTLDAALEMDTQYVDIVGLGNNPRSVFIDGFPVDQRVANCNISGVWIEQLQNAPAGSADATCVLSDCIFGTSTTEALVASDVFTRTFLRCRFNKVGRASNFNTIGGICEGCEFEGSFTLYIAAAAQLRYCTFEVTLTASGATAIKCYHCAFSADPFAGNLTNDIATAYNVVDSDVVI